MSSQETKKGFEPRLLNSEEAYQVLFSIQIRIMFHKWVLNYFYNLLHNLSKLFFPVLSWKYSKMTFEFSVNLPFLLITSCAQRPMLKSLLKTIGVVSSYWGLTLHLEPLASWLQANSKTLFGWLVWFLCLLFLLKCFFMLWNLMGVQQNKWIL